ncbi:hypothetical protein [Porphyromonas sp.]|uniref:TPM domain-containing protein n=1 Tax=Porphyromonas sp. TaxID=1924944 RepID=UPI0026DD311B|nr:hypothetical protein [Porphyromonas sp.]MDO4771574.1 hypothetical protein [Porphyromonas sp.]
MRYFCLYFLSLVGLLWGVVAPAQQAYSVQTVLEEFKPSNFQKPYLFDPAERLSLVQRDSIQGIGRTMMSVGSVNLSVIIVPEVELGRYTSIEEYTGVLVNRLRADEEGPYRNLVLLFRVKDSGEWSLDIGVHRKFKKTLTPEVKDSIATVIAKDMDDRQYYVAVSNAIEMSAKSIGLGDIKQLTAEKMREEEFTLWIVLAVIFAFSLFVYGMLLFDEYRALKLRSKGRLRSANIANITVLIVCSILCFPSIIILPFYFIIRFIIRSRNRFRIPCENCFTPDKYSFVDELKNGVEIEDLGNDARFKYKIDRYQFKCKSCGAYFMESVRRKTTGKRETTVSRVFTQDRQPLHN